MCAKSLRMAGLLLTLMLVTATAVTPAYAAGQSQQGGATGGINNWYTLEPGKSIEWLFNYLGNNDRALIAFGVNPAGSISVSVYNNSQWRALGNGDTSIVPVGKGTTGTIVNWTGNKDLLANGSLFWEANSSPAETFHIQVTNTSAKAVQYWIDQGGTGAGGLTSFVPVGPAFTVGSQAVTGPEQVQPQQSGAVAAPAQSTGSATTALPPPTTLPVSGAEAGGWHLALLFGFGVALTAAGWRMRQAVRPASCRG